MADCACEVMCAPGICSVVGRVLTQPGTGMRQSPARDVSVRRPFQKSLDVIGFIALVGIPKRRELRGRCVCLGAVWLGLPGCSRPTCALSVKPWSGTSHLPQTSMMWLFRGRYLIRGPVLGHEFPDPQERFCRRAIAVEKCVCATAGRDGEDGGASRGASRGHVPDSADGRGGALDTAWRHHGPARCQRAGCGPPAPRHGVRPRSCPGA